MKITPRLILSLSKGVLGQGGGDSHLPQNTSERRMVTVANDLGDVGDGDAHRALRFVNTVEPRAIRL